MLYQMPRPALDHPTPQPRNMGQQKEEIAKSSLPSWWESPSKGKTSQNMNFEQHGLGKWKGVIL